MVALFRERAGGNGTPKNLRMEPHPLNTAIPPPDLGIGSTNRPAAATSQAASGLTPQPQAPRLLDRLRGEIRVRYYSIHTESAYVDFARRFILFHGKRHLKDMGALEVEAFLTRLSVERNVAAAIQNQARSTQLFFSARR